MRSVGEAQVSYPAIRKLLPDGDLLADRGLVEHQQVKQQPASTMSTVQCCAVQRVGGVGDAGVPHLADAGYRWPPCGDGAGGGHRLVHLKIVLARARSEPAPSWA